MPDYPKIAAGARASIERAGRKVPIKRTTNNVDQISGRLESSADQTGTLALVTLPSKQNKAENFDRIFERDTFTKSDVLYCIAAADGASFEPDLLDEITLPSGAWEIRGIGVLDPAGVQLIYKLGLVKK